MRFYFILPPCFPGTVPLTKLLGKHIKSGVSSRIMMQSTGIPALGYFVCSKNSFKVREQFIIVLHDGGDPPFTANHTGDQGLQFDRIRSDFFKSLSGCAWLSLFILLKLMTSWNSFSTSMLCLSVEWQIVPCEWQEPCCWIARHL